MEAQALVFVAIVGTLLIVIAVLLKRIATQKSTIESIAARSVDDLNELEKRYAAEKEEASKRFETEKNAIYSWHYQVMDESSRQHEEELRRAREEIDARREALSVKTAKDILIDVVIALDGYAGRMQRVEERLAVDEVVGSIQHMKDEVSESLDEYMHSVRKRIEAINENVLAGIDVNRVLRGLDDIHADTEKLSTVLVFLESIESGMGKIQCDIESPFGYESIGSQIEGLRSIVEDTREAAEEGRDAANSARYAAEEVNDLAEEAKDAAEEARRAAENAEYAADRARDAAEGAKSAAEGAEYAANSAQSAAESHY